MRARLRAGLTFARFNPTLHTLVNNYNNLHYL